MYQVLNIEDPDKKGCYVCFDKISGRYYGLLEWAVSQKDKILGEIKAPLEEVADWIIESENAGGNPFVFTTAIDNPEWVGSDADLFKGAELKWDFSFLYLHNGTPVEEFKVFQKDKSSILDMQIKGGQSGAFSLEARDLNGEKLGNFEYVKDSETFTFQLDLNQLPLYGGFDFELSAKFPGSGESYLRIRTD
jgi:hypothetical protein